MGNGERIRGILSDFIPFGRAKEKQIECFDVVSVVTLEQKDTILRKGKTERRKAILSTTVVQSIVLVGTPPKHRFS